MLFEVCENEPQSAFVKVENSNSELICEKVSFYGKETDVCNIYNFLYMEYFNLIKTDRWQ
jgi:hypothetical protein